MRKLKGISIIILIIILTTSIFFISSCTNNKNDTNKDQNNNASDDGKPHGIMTYNWVYVIREDRKYNLKEENVIIEVYFGCIVKKENLMNSEPIDVKLYVQTYPYETPINLVGKDANDRNCTPIYTFEDVCAENYPVMPTIIEHGNPIFITIPNESFIYSKGIIYLWTKFGSLWQERSFYYEIIDDVVHVEKTLLSEGEVDWYD